MMHDGGAKAFIHSRRQLCRELWRVWSPNWQFDDATFGRTAAAWDNPDWVDVTIQSYRFRWRATAGDERYADLESLMSGQPPITVPTTVLHGASDGANLIGGSAAKQHFFTGRYRRKMLPGIGHFVQREAPESVLDAIRNPQ
jgi:pimeloyl-ACP methyl ester carboxylesterase